jgi:hypothetical protein
MTAVRKLHAPGADPAAVGVRVLAVLAANRARILDARRRRLRELRALVAAELQRDLDARMPTRGRAARIVRRLARFAPERTVRRVLASLPEWQKDARTLRT